MDWQNLMVVPGAYPAPKASDAALRQQLAQAALNKVRAHHRPGQAGAADLPARSQMHSNLEKVISTTLASWAAQDAARRLAAKRPR